MTPEDRARFHRVKEIFAEVAEVPAHERGRALRLHCGGDEELARQAEELLRLTLALVEHAGAWVSVMELLEGETLEDRIRREKRLAPEAALPIVRQICEGLEAIHRAGAVHRDLKPSNIVLAQGRAVIIDLGLAATENDPSLTMTGAVVGTLAYIAPELLYDGGGSPASDLYAMGVLMYEMLTGEKPHSPKSPFRLALLKAKEAHRSPRLLSRNVPAVWQEAITRCLRAEPRKRIGSAGELARLLDSGQPTLTFHLRRAWAPVASFAAALVVLLLWSQARAGHRPDPAAASQFLRAQAAMVSGAPLRAVRLLEQAVAKDPEFVKARSLLAVAYVQLDQRDKAGESMIEATRTADARWVLGRAEALSLDSARAAVLRDYHRAAAGYAKLAEAAQGTERSQALLLHSRMLARADDYDQAQRAVESVLRVDPANVSGRVGRALLLCRKGLFEEAEREFARAEASLNSAADDEGLADLLLARVTSLRTLEPAGQRRDLERVLALGARTGNRYHTLSASFRMALVAVRERDYDGAIRISRATAEQALREGMPLVAAASLGELGNSLLFAKKNEEAVPVLHESVAMAERARNASLIAANRMRLGEALFNIRRLEEGVAAMEQAVEWYRKSGPPQTLPLILVKWGTALGGTRWREAEPVFQKALELTEKDARLRLHKAMALQRLGSFYGDRDLRRSVEYWDRAIALASETRLTGAFFQAAQARRALGDFRRAESLITEGDAQVRTYPPGMDRSNFERYAQTTRASLAHARGECREAARILAALDRRDSGAQLDFHRYRACSPGVSPQTVRQGLGWAEREAGSPDRISHPRSHAVAAELALRAGDWERAKAWAERGLAVSHEFGMRARALENTLVLRAAEFRLGNRAAAWKLTAQCLELASELGFDEPAKFGGRRDLIGLWMLTPSEPTKSRRAANDVDQTP